MNGAADGAPGLAVDRYADVAIIHADAPSVLEEWLAVVREELVGRPRAEASPEEVEPYAV